MLIFVFPSTPWRYVVGFVSWARGRSLRACLSKVGTLFKVETRRSQCPLNKVSGARSDFNGVGFPTSAVGSIRKSMHILCVSNATSMQEYSPNMLVSCGGCVYGHKYIASFCLLEAMCRLPTYVISQEPPKEVASTCGYSTVSRAHLLARGRVLRLWKYSHYFCRHLYLQFQCE